MKKGRGRTKKKEHDGRVTTRRQTHRNGENVQPLQVKVRKAHWSLEEVYERGEGVHVYIMEQGPELKWYVHV